MNRFVFNPVMIPKSIIFMIKRMGRVSITCMQSFAVFENYIQSLRTKLVLCISAEFQKKGAGCWLCLKYKFIDIYIELLQFIVV